MAWPKGVPRPEGQKPPRRAKGVPNKASLAWKELTRSICEDPDVQKKLRESCLGDMHLLVKVAEHAFGKPKQTGEYTVRRGYLMPNGEDIDGLDET